MNAHDFRALVLGLHLKAWRWLNPAHHRWVPRNLWWQLAPEIPLVAHTNVSLDQSAFQFYNDDGGESTATSVAAENTDATLNVDTVYHIRIQTDDTASGAENNVNFQLQRNLNGAGWVNVDGTSSVVQIAASQLVENGDTTARLTAPTGATFISPNSGQDEVNGLTGENNDIDFTDGVHDYVEVVSSFQILSADVVDSDVIQFRLVRSGGAVLGSYSVTPQATVSEAAPADLDQPNFRIRSGDTDTLNGTTDWAAALNTGATIDLETRFRIRYEIEASGGSVTDGFKLQYDLNEVGIWVDVPTTPLNWNDRESTARIEAVDSKQYADGDPTTDILAGSAGTFVTGEGVEEDNLTGSITLADGEHTEVEFCVLLHRYGDGPLVLNDGDTIDFRVVRDDGTAFATYTNIPRITVNYPAGLIGGVYPENPGNRIGPFEDANGNKYVFIEPTETNNVGMMLKSTDGGDTWAEVDGANRPSEPDLEGVEMMQGTGQLFILQHENTTPVLHIFNTSDNDGGPGSTDIWLSTDETLDPNLLDAPDQQITGAILSDGSIIAVYTGDTNDPWANADVWANIRDSGGTWGTPFQVWDLASNDNWGVIGVLGDNDNFYVFSCANDVGELYGKRITSAGALEDMFGAAVATSDTGTLIHNNVGTGNEDRQNHISPLYWNDGADKVWVGYRDDTHQNFVGRVITVGSGGSVGAESGAVNDDNQLAVDSSSRQPMACTVRTSDGDIHAFFAKESSDGAETDLTYDVSSDDGATWGTDETVTLRSPLSRINWIQARVLPSGDVGLFYDNASGIEQNNEASGGSNATGLAGLGTGFIWYDEYTLVSGEVLLKVESESEEASETDLNSLGLGRLEAESIQPGEAELSLLDLVRLESEVEEGRETPISVLDLLRFHSESLDLLETDNNIVGLFRQEEETTNISETDLSIRGIFRIQGEAVELSETDLSLRDLTRVLSETMESSETDLHLLSLLREVQEVVNLSETDLRFLALTRQEDESVQISEVVVPILGLLRLESDIVNISEADLSIRGIFRVQDEQVETSETDLSVRGVFRIENEVINLSEDDSTLLGLLRVESDPLNIQEADLKFLALLRTETETTQLTETDLALLDLLRQVSERSDLVESDIAIVTESGIAIIKVEDEKIEISELDISTRGFVRLDSETLNISEQSQVLLDLIRVESETSRMLETTFKFQALLRTESETINVNEQELTFLELLRLVSESENISESDIAIVTELGVALVKIIDEGINVSETDLHILGLVQVESEAIQESESTQQLRALARLVSESETLDEAVLRLQTLTRVQGESVSLPEGVVRALSLFRQQIEALNTQETPTFIRGLPAKIVSETLQAAELTLRFVAVAISGTLRQWRDFKARRRTMSGKRDYKSKSRDYD